MGYDVDFSEVSKTTYQPPLLRVIISRSLCRVSPELFIVLLLNLISVVELTHESSRLLLYSLGKLF